MASVSFSGAGPPFSQLYLQKVVWKRQRVDSFKDMVFAPSWMALVNFSSAGRRDRSCICTKWCGIVSALCLSMRWPLHPRGRHWRASLVLTAVLTIASAPVPRQRHGVPFLSLPKASRCMHIHLAQVHSKSAQQMAGHPLRCRGCWRVLHRSTRFAFTLYSLDAQSRGCIGPGTHLMPKSSSGPPGLWLAVRMKPP